MSKRDRNFTLTIGMYFFVALFLYSCVNSVSAKELNFQRLEIAETLEQIQTGLMNREILCENCGMLFIMPTPTQLPFWMKNTYIPLDMIFISEKGYIVTIHPNTEPLNELKRYWPKKPAKYVIEVNAGYSKKHRLKEGQYIDIKKLIKKSVEMEISR